MTYLKDGKYIVIPDLQVPYHDMKAVNAVTKHIADSDYDGMLNVGDEADQPQPSRWSKGKAQEFSGDFEDHLIQTYDILKGFTDALGHDKPNHIIRSNHTDRLQVYLETYAPAMSRTSWNSYPAIMGFDNRVPMLEGRDTPLPIVWHDRVWQFTKEWMMGHGDEGGSSTTPGGTAMGLAKKTGLSTICGHTHKMGYLHQHSGANGKITTALWGLEVGNLMDMSKAQYLDYGFSNWQSGFVVLHIRKGKVYPELVPFQGQSFSVGGKLTVWK